MLTRAVLGSLLLLPLVAACGSESSSADGSCSYVAGSMGAAKEAELPRADPAADAPSRVVVSTSQGDIPITLSPDAAPCTVNSFVSLVQQGYYDGTTCHRFINDFMIQCGDPSATGSGGPGYSFADELTGEEQYKTGVVAMANSGPDTNGSQFFMMVADYPLDPDYTVFGQVDAAGLEVLEKINSGGNGPDGVAPSPAVDITSVK